MSAVVGWWRPWGRGLGRSRGFLGRAYAWDHLVTDGAREAIDEKIDDLGDGAKDVAEDVGDAVTFWN